MLRAVTAAKLVNERAEQEAVATMARYRQEMLQSQMVIDEMERASYAELEQLKVRRALSLWHCVTVTVALLGTTAH